MDFAPPPKLWTPSRPALVRAASLKDLHPGDLQLAFGGAAAAMIASSGGSTVTTSYANNGGTGSRTSIITVTSTGMSLGAGSAPNIVNGVAANNSTDGFWTNGPTLSGSVNLRFDFGSGNAVYIDEAKLYFSSVGSNQGIWQWQGSNDASSWTSIGGNVNMTSNTAIVTMTQLNGNVTPYRYYQMIGVSGSSSTTPWWEEMEFKIFGI